MIKVRQNTYLERESTGTKSELKIVSTWVNPRFIVCVEDISSFGEHWNSGTDYIVHCSSGTEIQCVGDVNEFMDKVNTSLMPYCPN